MSFQSPGPTSNTNTQTSTAQTSAATKSPPDWFLNAWQTILGLGGDLYGGLATPVAGLTSDQSAASYWANNALQEYMTRARIPAYDVFGMGSQWDKGPYPVAVPNLGQGGAVAAQATPAQMTAAQLNPSEIAPFMNPFISTALDPTLNRLRQQQGEVQADIGSKAAAAGAYGGSREAVERMLADRNYRDTLAQTTGQMLLQGWNNASGLASTNAGYRQQGAVVNAQLDNAIRMLNAQLATAVSQGNWQLANQLALAGAQMQNQAQQQYQQLQYSGAQSDAARFLQAVQAQGGLDAQNLQSILGATGVINQYGTQQQQTAQAALDAYWKQLNQLGGLLRLGDPGYLLNQVQNTLQNQTQQQTGTKPLDIGSVLLGAIKLGLL